VVAVVSRPVVDRPFESVGEFPHEVRERSVLGPVSGLPVATAIGVAALDIAGQDRRRRQLLESRDRRLGAERAPTVEVLSEESFVERRLEPRQHGHRLDGRREREAVIPAGVVQRPRTEPIGEKRNGVGGRFVDATGELAVETGHEVETVGAILPGTDLCRFVGVDRAPLAALVGDAVHFAPDPHERPVVGLGGLVGCRPLVERRANDDPVFAVGVGHLATGDGLGDRLHLDAVSVPAEYTGETDHLKPRRSASARPTRAGVPRVRPRSRRRRSAGTCRRYGVRRPPHRRPR